MLTPSLEQITAKLAFLSDDLSVSYAESLLGVVAQNQLGIIVGSPSMGANGNVAKQRLVGGARVQWTGMEVYGPDDSSRNRVGVQPTHAVRPTAAGCRRQR